MALPSYLILEDLLPRSAAIALAERARGERHWKLHEEWFFSQNDVAWVRREFGRSPVGEMTPEITALWTAGVGLVESQMNAVIGGHYTVIGHKMVADQVVGIHNDSPDLDRGRIENYRLIYYVDDEYSDDKGGYLLLFSGGDGAEITDAVRPLFNSAVLMHLSDSSYHAVSRIQRGVRYSLVVSYWGYPLLFEAPREAGRVRRCIKRIIELGLEEVGHSGTTFAYHLFHTFRLLHGWKQDIDVCLAGLMHSLLGRELSGVRESGIARSELKGLVGERAFHLIEHLEVGSGLAPGPRVSAEVSNALFVLELANLLEQSQSRAELAEVESRLARFERAPSELRTRVTADIARAREALTTTPGKSLMRV